eukprot:TRINITY_DN2173_c0_g1_i1.p1 TRINITY_DN2173_c0_g1~~TRINITY_DN2173_c0_g1_i1.p1  ORF type:complete len:987 (+),score=212.31 TRINITY_DN2173_c0_g1_i1:39-2999(+)
MKSLSLLIAAVLFVSSAIVVVNAVQQVYRPSYIVISSQSQTSYNSSRSLTLSIPGLSLASALFTNVNFSTSWDVLAIGPHGALTRLPQVVTSNTSITIPPLNLTQDQLLRVAVSVSAYLLSYNSSSAASRVNLGNGLVSYGNVTVAPSMKTLVFSANSVARCLAAPWSGIPYVTVFEFACSQSSTSPTSFSSTKISISLVKANASSNDSISLVQMLEAAAYSTILPTGVWIPMINISAANGTLIKNVSLNALNVSTDLAVAGAVCPFTALERIINETSDLAEATLALELISEAILNDSEVLQYAQVCNISDISVWRNENRPKWMRMLTEINQNFPVDLNVQRQVAILNNLVNSSISVQDMPASSEVNQAAVGALSSVINVLLGLSSANQFVPQQVFEQTFSAFPQIWNAESNSDCSDASLGTQETLLQTFLLASSASEFSNRALQVLSYSASGDVSFTLGSIKVRFPAESFARCVSNTSEVQILHSEFTSHCRSMTNSSISPSGTYTVRIVENGTTVCDIRNLQDSIIIEISSSTVQAEAICGWYNPTSQDWKTDGCVTVVSSDGVQCKCNHLTEFALLMISRNATSSIQVAQFLNQFGSIPMNSFFVFCFSVAAILLCFQTFKIRISSQFNKGNLATVVFPVHLIMLALCILHLVFLGLSLSAFSLKSVPVIALIQSFCMLTLLPIILFFLLSGFCIFSWMQVYHVNVKNDMTDHQFQRWRSYFLITSCALSLIILTVAAFASNTSSTTAALRIFQALMGAFACTCLLLSLLFLAYGSKIYSEIHAIQVKIFAVAKDSMFSRSNQLQAAIRTQRAGVLFCISSAFTSASWMAYARFLSPDGVENVNKLLILSAIRYCSELLAIASCVWLYKNAVPDWSTIESQRQHSSRSKQHMMRDRRGSSSSRRPSRIRAPSNGGMKELQSIPSGGAMTLTPVAENSSPKAGDLQSHHNALETTGNFSAALSSHGSSPRMAFTLTLESTDSSQ